MEGFYYIRNKDAGFIGNSLVWWKIDNNGYTPDLNEAKVFSEKESLEVMEASPGKFERRLKTTMDRIAQRHVDMQDI